MPEVENQPGLRVLLDENMPSSVAAWLKSHRPHWDVFLTSEVELQGSADPEVFQWAQDNRCLIVTLDRDFGDRGDSPQVNITESSTCGSSPPRQKRSSVLWEGF